MDNESDYEDEHFRNPVAESESTRIKNEEESDSQDSDNSEHYFKSFNQDAQKIRLETSEVYHSCNQNSDNEDSNEDEQLNKVHEAEGSYVTNTLGFTCKKEYQDSSDDSENEPIAQDLHTEFQKDRTGINRKRSHSASQSKKARTNEFYPDSSKKKIKLEDPDTNTADDTNKFNDERTPKISKAFAGSNNVMRMMKLMGYQDGHGLGKNKQGRLDPVQAHKQKGYSGLGFRNRGLEKASLQWDSCEEVVKAVEDIEWLENTHQHAPREKEMHNWIQSGPKKDTINDETHFCDPGVVADIINSKTVFDTLDKNAMRNARTRSNPYETIRGAFFLNRAAVKMANMDKACDMMFTNPRDMDPDELLYFADVCAGPGGFSEYVLWRKKWHAKGFGFTLKKENDFKLSDFYAGPCETFYPFYGPKEDGDVFKPVNQKAFRDLIMTYTTGKGVHFMMSDGGFSVEGQENIQEILSKQLYLCQCIVALMIVRNDGHFVTKLFDLFTPFSAGLVYLMYRCFDKISIFKPNSSRPANSERYLICKGKRHDTNGVLQHLLRINDLLIKQSDKHTDILEIVPLELLTSEEEFYQYLKLSNEMLGRKQITGLLKIAAYCDDSTKMELRQAEMRKQCLEYWEIPTDKTRTVPRLFSPQEKLQMLLKKNTLNLSRDPVQLTTSNVSQAIVDSYRDWFFMPCESGKNASQKCKFYLGLGRQYVYCFENGIWVQNQNMNLELPADTLFYAETVLEHASDSRNQCSIPALHIVDAYILGGEDISKMYLEDRHKLIKKFCRALWKPTDMRIRAKDMYPLNSSIKDCLKVKPRQMKNGQQMLGYDLPKTPMDDYSIHKNATPYFIPKSIIFLKSTAPYWSRHYSKKHCATYVFNSKYGSSHYDNQRRPEAGANFIETFMNHYIWYWLEDHTITMNNVVELLKQSKI